MSPARATPVPAEAQPDSGLDFVDVPAAVVCAFCGRPDCAGCLDVPEPTQGSGVVAIVPWERPGSGGWSRLWATAKLATLSPAELFAALPDGSLAGAFAFALLAELIAVAGLALTVLPSLLFVPDVIALLASDVVLRALFVRLVAFGIPGLALAMVALHALHGLLTDRAARRRGSEQRGRGLRFGLYACGWDLVTLPAGLFVVAVTDGFRTAGRAALLSLGAPSLSTRAYLSGVHRLSAADAKLASHRAALTTVGIAAFALLCAGVAAGVALY